MYEKIDIINVRIETPRLILRPLRPEDLEDFYAYCSVPGVGEPAGWPHHESMEESKKVLDMLIAEGISFGLELKSTGHLIGTVCIDELETPPEIENCRGLIMGYDLSMDCWGQGLMPEAVRFVCGYVFDVLGYDYISCGIQPENIRSIRVAEKCGLRFFRVREFPMDDGRIERDYLYLLQRGENNV